MDRKQFYKRCKAKLIIVWRIEVVFMDFVDLNIILQIYLGGARE